MRWLLSLIQPCFSNTPLGAQPASLKCPFAAASATEECTDAMRSCAASAGAGSSFCTCYAQGVDCFLAVEQDGELCDIDAAFVLPTLSFCSDIGCGSDCKTPSDDSTTSIVDPASV